MTRILSLKLLTIALSPMACSISNIKSKDDGAPPPGKDTKSRLIQTKLPEPFVTYHSIPKGSSLYNSLKKEGISSATILHWIQSSKGISSMEDVSAGTQYQISWSSPDKMYATKFELRYAADSSLVLEKEANNLEWTAKKIQLPVTITHKTFNGVVDKSLWESAEIVGVDPSLISSLAEVFAWQIDFSRAVKVGDRWRLTVEQKWVEDKQTGWGNILVAEYKNEGQLYTGVRFPQTGETASYYAPNGQSLKRMFLKSPLKFGHITSGFSSSRFHPVLKENRPHNGVDYGAPQGTPVLAVGRGTVEIIGSHGGSGKTIRIRHNDIYSTAYLHLSGYSPGLHKGSQVEQGQVIGFVGSTGLATGPHLHFSFYDNGIYRDPISIRFPSADPVPTEDMSQFQKIVATTLRTLPAWQIAQNQKRIDQGSSMPNTLISPRNEQALFH